MSKFIESLEARELMSATRAVDAQVAADLAAIANDKAIIIRDHGNGLALIKADKARIPAIRALGAATLRADKLAILQARGSHDAVQAAKGQLLIDKGTTKSDLAELKATLKADKTGLVATLRDDKAQLVADKRKLRNDRLAARFG